MYPDPARTLKQSTAKTTCVSGVYWGEYILVPSFEHLVDSQGSHLERIGHRWVDFGGKKEVN
jgi:hypothetical protein